MRKAVREEVDACHHWKSFFVRLGLFERDLADRFGTSISTVSHICCFGTSISTVSHICITWLNFLHLKLKELPLWPGRDLVKSYMPQVFKDLYTDTRVIFASTEVFIEAPSLPELQQMTISSYKNRKTFKGLVGISSGVEVTFISSLLSGFITDKQLTQRGGLLELLETGYCAMADRSWI